MKKYEFEIIEEVHYIVEATTEKEALTKYLNAKEENMTEENISIFNLTKGE